MATRGDMREDIEKWDVHVVRRWPYWTVGGAPVALGPVPPVGVSISVDFTNEASALEFEAAVRGLLQPGQAA